MRLNSQIKKKKKKEEEKEKKTLNLVLINNATHQREAETE